MEIELKHLKFTNMNKIYLRFITDTNVSNNNVMYVVIMNDFISGISYYKIYDKDCQQILIVRNF